MIFKQAVRLSRFACQTDDLLRNSPAGSPAGANLKTNINISPAPRSKTNRDSSLDVQQIP